MLNSKLHPLNFLILAIFYIGATFFAHTFQQYTMILIATGINIAILSNQIKFKAVLIFVLSLTPVLCAMFISGYFYASDISHRQDIAYYLTLRTFCLAFVSFTFSIHTPYQMLINYLMQKKLLSVRIGYSLLAVFNSFHHLGDEFKRVQLAYKMRYHKRFLSPRVIITLLTVAARYAHNLSISMHSRGLNNKKTFIEKTTALKLYDYLFWLVNIYGIAYFML